MTRRELAQLYFRQGYNCSMSVAKAFADLADVEESQLLKLMAPFGGGMGRLREVCGALSGCMAILGLLQGYDTPETGTEKAALYAKVQTIALQFEEKNGSIVCRELLGLPAGHSAPTPSPRTGAFYADRPCEALIGDAAELLERFLAGSL